MSDKRLVNFTHHSSFITHHVKVLAMQNVTPAVDPRPIGRRKPARWRRYLVWYALIAPNVILFMIFGLLPIVATVLISFTRWNILGSPSWIGLQNFQRLLHDAEFWTSLRVTLV